MDENQVLEPIVTVEVDCDLDDPIVNVVIDDSEDDIIMTAPEVVNPIDSDGAVCVETPIIEEVCSDDETVLVVTLPVVMDADVL